MRGRKAVPYPLGPDVFSIQAVLFRPVVNTGALPP